MYTGNLQNKQKNGGAAPPLAAALIQVQLSAARYKHCPITVSATVVYSQ